MSIKTQLQYRLARWAMKSAQLSYVPMWVRESFLEPSFYRLTREGYAINSAVFACISRLAFAYPEAPSQVTDQAGKPLPNHPLQKLLRRPNPQMSEAELNLYTIIYRAIGGQCYLHKVRNSRGMVVELWPYHPGHMRPVHGLNNWIEFYRYDLGDGKTRDIPAEDIIHLKWPSVDPDQPWLAMPPLRAAAREVDTDVEAGRYIYALLRNDAVARTILTVPGTLSDPQFERLKQQWTIRHGGDNRGNTAIVEGGAKIERIALNLQEMAIDALRNVPETRIAAAFGVPPIIANLNVGLERSTFSNYGEARKAFTEDTLVPLWRMSDDEYERDLGDEFGGNVLVTRDLSKVQALQENEDAKYTRVLNAFKQGILLKNEARRMLGLQDLKEEHADKPQIYAYHIQAGVVTVNEVRASLGLPPIPGGDVPTQPAARTEQPVKIIDQDPVAKIARLSAREIKRLMQSGTPAGIEEDTKTYLQAQYERAAQAVRA